MLISRFHKPIGKVCALVAATLILPALAYADRDSGKGNKGDNDGQRGGEKNEHQWGDHNTDSNRDRHISTVPDGSPGIVLLATTIGAILFFSWRQSSRAKAEAQR
jgi:hypothetical protein